MAAIVKFKNLFKSQKATAHSYKQRNFLNTLPPEKLSEILLFLEADKLNKLVPDSAGKRILFFDDQQHSFVKRKILSKSSQGVVNYVYHGETVSEQMPGHYTVMGDINRLCLVERQFDIIVCPFALGKDHINFEIIDNLNKSLKNGGRFIMSLRHPHLENILYNQNPSENRVLENSLSRYFKLLKEQFLYLENLEEAAIDHTVKPFFNQGDINCIHEYKGIPMVLFLRAVKFVRSNE